MAEPKKPEPKYEKYLAERVKCKPPKKRVARSEPVRQIQPEGSTDSEDSYSDADLDLEPVAVVEPRSEPRRVSLKKPIRIRKQPPLLAEQPVDLDALRDKYRPKVAEKEPAPADAEVDTKASPEPTGTILLEPIRPPTPPLEEIKVEPIQPTYVEMKKPLKRKCSCVIEMKLF